MVRNGLEKGLKKRRKGDRERKQERNGSLTSVRIKQSCASIIINQDVNNEGKDSSESGQPRMEEETRQIRDDCGCNRNVLLACIATALCIMHTARTAYTSLVRRTVTQINARYFTLY